MNLPPNIASLSEQELLTLKQIIDSKLGLDHPLQQPQALHGLLLPRNRPRDTGGSHNGVADDADDAEHQQDRPAKQPKLQENMVEVLVSAIRRLTGLGARYVLLPLDKTAHSGQVLYAGKDWVLRNAPYQCHDNFFQNIFGECLEGYLEEARAKVHVDKDFIKVPVLDGTSGSGKSRGIVEVVTHLPALAKAKFCITYLISMGNGASITEDELNMFKSTDATADFTTMVKTPSMVIRMLHSRLLYAAGDDPDLDEYINHILKILGEKFNKLQFKHLYEAMEIVYGLSYSSTQPGEEKPLHLLGMDEVSKLSENDLSVVLRQLGHLAQSTPKRNCFTAFSTLLLSPLSNSISASSYSTYLVRYIPVLSMEQTFTLIQHVRDNHEKGQRLENFRSERYFVAGLVRIPRLPRAVTHYLYHFLKGEQQTKQIQLESDCRAARAAATNYLDGLGPRKQMLAELQQNDKLLRDIIHHSVFKSQGISINASESVYLEGYVAVGILLKEYINTTTVRYRLNEGCILEIMEHFDTLMGTARQCLNQLYTWEQRTDTGEDFEKVVTLHVTALCSLRGKLDSAPAMHPKRTYLRHLFPGADFTYCSVISNDLEIEPPFPYCDMHAFDWAQLTLPHKLDAAASEEHIQKCLQVFENRNVVKNCPQAESGDQVMVFRLPKPSAEEQQKKVLGWVQDKHSRVGSLLKRSQIDIELEKNRKAFKRIQEVDSSFIYSFTLIVTNQPLEEAENDITHDDLAIVHKGNMDQFFLIVKPLAQFLSTTQYVYFNIARKDELKLLPDIGNARADLILKERTANGAFTSKEDLILRMSSLKNMKWLQDDGDWHIIF